DTKRVLQMASVIGRIFLYRVLAAIAEEERRLDQQLRTLQHEELIRERARIPELEYIFKHELTREAAYNGLLKKERRAFHREVAQALERLFPERAEEQLGLLAHHWERAGDAEKALHCLQRAGDQARLIYAHDEAVGYYRRALTLLKESERYEQAARTLMKLGLTYDSSFDFRRARAAYDEAFALWQRASSVEPASRLPPVPHALRLVWPNVRTLDPTRCTSGVSGEVIDQLFSGLVELTVYVSIAPDVAQSWHVTDGGRKYTFRLRDDVVWSDGTPVTAYDFAYAWRRVLDPVIGSPNATLLYDVVGARDFRDRRGRWSDVGIKVADAGTLVVELEGPVGYFLQLMASSAAYPVPRHVVEACGEAWTEPGNIVTNGPFRMAAWVKGKSLALMRRAHYHGRCRGNLGRVELSLRSVNERSTTALELYERDGLDILDLNILPVEQLADARQRHAVDCLTTPSLATYYLGFHPERPPFDDPRVRQAFVLATDREWLNAQAGGRSSARRGGFVPFGMPGHSAGIGLPYDPDRARDLLVEAGYPGGRGFPALDALVARVSIPRWRRWPDTGAQTSA
ncbi:MAG: ABC transporter substrate-binding protein, partial [Anaerolineae bacterium]